jgi:hypothetical protein
VKLVKLGEKFIQMDRWKEDRLTQIMVHLSRVGKEGRIIDKDTSNYLGD